MACSDCFAYITPAPTKLLPAERSKSQVPISMSDTMSILLNGAGGGGTAGKKAYMRNYNDRAWCRLEQLLWEAQHRRPCFDRPRRGKRYRIDMAE